KTTPLQRFLFQVYQQAFRSVYFRELKAFRSATQRSHLIVMHVSCAPSLERAMESAASFARITRIKILIVIGQCGGRAGRYLFDNERRLLTVPASDAYEGLPQKV